MKTLFKSQELWDIVETGYTEPEEAPAVPSQQLRENRNKDAKALFFIQLAVDDEIFPRIADSTTSNMAWNTLKQEYLGDKKIISVKLQTLSRKFETLAMAKTESVQVYLSRVSEVVNLMKSYGEKITTETVVSKVLRSLTAKFDHVVAAIEESNDLSTYTYDKLMSSLMAHEDRLGRADEKAEEKAFQVKDDAFSKGMNDGLGSRGRGRSGYHGKGRGGGRGRDQFNDQRHQFKSNIQCRYCKKFGHKEAYCWTKQKDEAKGANFVEKVAGEENLFMAHSPFNSDVNGVWFMDSGCSNHMTGTRTLFKELDESQKSEVHFGDDRLVKVEGKGTISINTSQGNVKLLHNVQFVPELSHNLLSVGQLMEDGYFLLFDDGVCSVYDKNSGQHIVSIPKRQNKMFPLQVSDKKNCAFNVKHTESNLWHLRYGHLNVGGLKLLARNNMVIGLPVIDGIDFCEGCVYGKQTKYSFPVNKAWRASKCLQLVHADVCGLMSVESLGGSRYFLLFTDDYSRMS